jgi:hypothetical protein
MEINMDKSKAKKISSYPSGTGNNRSKPSGECGIYKLYE